MLYNLNLHFNMGSLTDTDQRRSGVMQFMCSFEPYNSNGSSCTWCYNQSAFCYVVTKNQSIR